jgi:uncharacterized protein YprB with RNaseH-like and TPR domain
VSELFERLRRLRREGGATSPPSARAGTQTAAGLPLDLLAERTRRLGGGESHGLASIEEGAPARRGSRSIGPLPDLETLDTEHGRYAVRRRAFAREARHGDFALAEIAAAARAALACLTRDERLHELDLERAVFLDIETTGLSGGAGTIPFLVALGTFTAEGFVLWQGFLPGPEGERALLVEVAERVRASSGVVSFFGKSFDRHRLEDKMRIHRIAPPFESKPHLDLYHPCARLYRSALGDGRLSTFERVLCGVVREDDLPGSFAPEAWFDFLAGRAHRLEAVFRHNERDVLSLVTLAAHLGRTLDERRADGRELAGPGAARAAALARLHADGGEHAEALTWTERALERAGRSVRELEFQCAELKLRLRRHEEALVAFEAVAEGERDELALRALIEIAKIAEHALRDLGRARAAVDRARDVARVSIRGSRAVAELEKRSERLLRKQCN